MKTVSRFLSIVLLAIILAGCCPKFKPDLGVGYDVLRPNEAVKLNPLSFTAEGNLVVNPAFMSWVLELEQEIAKLRKYLKGK